MKILAVVFLAGLIANAQTRTPLQRAPSRSSGHRNPFDGDGRAQRAGEKLYVRECASCHGLNGDGTSKAPALRRGEVQHAEAGALFWVLRNGSVRRGMPSFAHLPEARRWQIITYLQSLDRKAND
jgi:mono/diheme cytochrome c family protein